MNWFVWASIFFKEKDAVTEPLLMKKLSTYYWDRDWEILKSFQMFSLLLIVTTDKRLGWGGMKWRACLRSENSQAIPQNLFFFFKVLIPFDSVLPFFSNFCVLWNLLSFHCHYYYSEVDQTVIPITKGVLFVWKLSITISPVLVKCHYEVEAYTKLINTFDVRQEREQAFKHYNWGANLIVTVFHSTEENRVILELI